MMGFKRSTVMGIVCNRVVCVIIFACTNRICTFPTFIIHILMMKLLYQLEWAIITPLTFLNKCNAKTEKLTLKVKNFCLKIAAPRNVGVHCDEFGTHRKTSVRCVTTKAAFGLENSPLGGRCDQLWMQWTRKGIRC